MTDQQSGSTNMHQHKTICQTVTPCTSSGRTIPRCQTQPATWAGIKVEQQATGAHAVTSPRPGPYRQHPNPSDTETGPTTQLRDTDRTEGGSGRAPSKHGGAAHALSRHERDAETQPCAHARPGQTSTEDPIHAATDPVQADGDT